VLKSAQHACCIAQLRTIVICFEGDYLSLYQRFTVKSQTVSLSEELEVYPLHTIFETGLMLQHTVTFVLLLFT
jgi:hypothetical protein